MGSFTLEYFFYSRGGEVEGSLDWIKEGAPGGDSWNGLTWCHHEGKMGGMQTR